MAECEGNDSLEAINTVMSVITAVGTLLIALVAQVFSKRQQELQEIDDRKKALLDTCNEINIGASTSLFMNQRVMFNGQMVYLSGRDWNNIWNTSDYADPKQLASRLVFTEYIDAVRACSEVFGSFKDHKHEHRIFSGKYDFKTKALRFTAKAFRRWYTMEFDGVAEERRSYAQREVGNKRDWNKIIKLLAIFDDKFDIKDFKWFLDPPKEEPKEEEDKEADDGTAKVEDGTA